MALSRTLWRRHSVASMRFEPWGSSKAENWRGSVTIPSVDIIGQVLSTFEPYYFAATCLGLEYETILSGDQDFITPHESLESVSR